MEIITPKEYVGSLIELSQERRGDFVDMKYMTEARTTLVYEMPLAEVHRTKCPTLMVARREQHGVTWIRAKPGYQICYVLRRDTSAPGTPSQGVLPLPMLLTAHAYRPAGGDRLLRPAEVTQPGLRFDGVPVDRLQKERPCAAGHQGTAL
jgi:Elongation factor G C-terminus